MIILLGRASVLVMLVIVAVLLVVLVIMLISDVASSIYGAPFVPIRKRIIKDLLSFSGLGADDIFYDLGSGDGRVLISAVKDFGVRTAIGYEVTLWPYLESLFNVWQSALGSRVKIHRQNFFRSELYNATFIYLYLFPKLVNTLAATISMRIKTGTKILSISFPINLDSYPQLRLLKTQKFGKITAYLYEKI